MTKSLKNPINQLMSNLFVTIASGLVIAILYKSFLDQSSLVPTNSGMLSLKWLTGKTIAQCTIFSIVVFTIIRIIIAIPTNIICHPRLKNNEGYIRNKFIVKNFVGGYLWGLANFFGWAGLGLFILTFEYGYNVNYNHEVLFTIALFGAAFHHTIAGLTWFLLQEIILGDSKDKDVEKLYNFDKKTLMRFYIPRFALSIGFGVMISLLSYLFKNENIFYLIYINRFEFTLMFIVIVIISYIFVIMLPNNTFFYRTIIYKNIGKIWIPMIILIVIGIYFGIELFESILKNHWFDVL